MSYWLPEDRILKLTTLEAGWLYRILTGLDRENGDAWPTAKPDENGNPIPTTMPRRLAEKVQELMDGE